MIDPFKFTKPNSFATAAGKSVITITPVLSKKSADALLKKMPAATRKHAAQNGFYGNARQVLPLAGKDGTIETLVVGLSTPMDLYDFSSVAESITRMFDPAVLKDTVFRIDGGDIDDAAFNADLACIGWGLSGYRFDAYSKKLSAPAPRLLWPKGADKKYVLSYIEAALTIRTMINIPANDFGPDELESAVKKFATREGCTLDIIRDKDLLKKNFPMIHAVGRGSVRRPRLLDLRWGDPSHPKVTLIGKGVCFDTGGYDLKPGAAMYTMKKDMGGAAHVLALALLLIREKAPVQLRVLIPAVENSISGDAFRPADILQSRKGLTVEVSDTDAEGRLILGDALAYASEDKPDLIIDFATLTGGVALGPDIPALFSNKKKLAADVQNLSEQHSDLLWALPLPQSYRRHMASDYADITSTGNARGGTIHAALFLESFVDAKIDWLHVDLFAWEPGGRPGRSRGGLEMGLRTMHAFIAQRYARKKNRKQ